MKKEKIIASAIIHNGVTYLGKRHHNVIASIKAATGERVPAHDLQGFWTNKERFLDRKQAAVLALKNGQVKELKYHSKLLFSEDLW